MKKILVIGGSGMVASKFIDLVKEKFEIISVDEHTIDLTKPESITNYFEGNNGFSVVINFAAFTNVDGAEVQKGDKNGLVWKLNVEGPKALAEVCKKKNIFLIHISTDFVFPGTPSYPGPYSENSALPANPDGIGWYGWTKNRAEKEISNIGGSFAIVRYGYPFRSDNFEKKKDWARNLINLYNEHKLYPLFADQVQSILNIDDLASPLAVIIDKEITGVFHIAASETTTPFEAGSYLLKKFTGKIVDVEKGSMEEFLKVPGRTPRPRLGGLKVENTEKILGIKFKTWQEMIDEFISKLKS